MSTSAAAPIAHSTVVRLGREPLHLIEVGRGPPVLLLHGLNAASHVFEPLWERAASRYRFLAVDLPCSGRSGRYCALEPARLARVLAKLLRERDAAPAVVVGHSFGGVVGMELLARCPEVVRGLVVLSAPALGLGGLRSVLALPFAERLWGGLGRFVRSPRLVRRYLELIRGEGAGPTGETVERYVEAMGHEGYHAATLEALRSLAHYHLPVEALRAAGAPRAVLWGERDPLLSVIQGEQVAHALGVPLTILSGAGHCLPEECPEALEAVLDGMLRRRRAKAPRARSRRGS